jgi:hypothetical protein
MVQKGVIELHRANSITQISPGKSLETYHSREKVRNCAGASSANYWRDRHLGWLETNFESGIKGAMFARSSSHLS